MSPGSPQGYIDERSIRHVAGWARDLSAPEERLELEFVVPDPGGHDRIIHRGRADAYSPVLVEVGVGDGCYAFRHDIDPPLTFEERDSLFVRPVGSAHRLELAPALRTEPPSRPGLRHEPFEGYIDALSLRHVAGWVRNRADPDERLIVEIALPSEEGDRIIWSGPSDRFSPVLKEVGVGDGGYSFYVVLPQPLSEAERNCIEVRPIRSDFKLARAPALQTEFEPISHVALDIVDNCNLRCPFCVYDYRDTHRTQFMSDEIFGRALQLIPFVTDGNFWLSCLHEATLHPGLLAFIDRVPTQHRRKLFYTTNLAKRMPAAYFAALAASGMHHLNVSLESLEPAIYERMRKGARHAIFQANWTMLLNAFVAEPGAPRLRYNLMAYRSNLAELPGLVRILLDEKHAWQVEIRHTYDEPHIDAAFRDAEFLDTADWAWLAEQCADMPQDRVLLLLPPGGVGHRRAGPIGSAAEPAPVAGPPSAAARSIPKPLQISMAWDGALRVYGEEPRGAGEPPAHVNYVTTNIAYLSDPLAFLLSL